MEQLFIRVLCFTALEVSSETQNGVKTVGAKTQTSFSLEGVALARLKWLPHRALSWRGGYQNSLSYAQVQATLLQLSNFTHSSFGIFILVRAGIWKKNHSLLQPCLRFGELEPCWKDSALHKLALYFSFWLGPLTVHSQFVGPMLLLFEKCSLPIRMIQLYTFHLA